MRELAVVVNNKNKEINPKDMIDTIYKVGFRNIFLQWYNDDSLKMLQEEQLEYARKIGLNVAFVHLGYKRINDIWDETLQEEEVSKVVDEYIEDIKACSKYGIDLVIMHLTSKSIAPKYNEKGLSRIKKIVDAAEKYNVRIAFENTKIEGYLEYVFTNIDSNNIGLCYDAGHCHAHFKDKFNYKFFENRIFAVHLHDNFGELDEHLLPFDGTIDWPHVMDKLEKCNYNSYITLEIAYKKEYLNMSMEEFYSEGINRGNKFIEIINENKS